jgi:endonuclease-3
VSPRRSSEAKTGKKAASKRSLPAKTPAGPKRPRRGRETARARKERVAEIIARLHAEYPEARISLEFDNPYELIVATILSAQCTDERVNMVTPALFKRFPTPDDLAGARPEVVEDMIRSTGFFRNKTKSLLGMANAVVDRHEGRIPNTMGELVRLPGVGRKTANVVLGNAFGTDEGIVVDTHVTRLSNRLALTRQQDAVKIEQDLVKIVPREEWTDFAHLFIHHGRAVCKAPTPRCAQCVLSDICPSSRV